VNLDAAVANVADVLDHLDMTPPRRPWWRRKRWRLAFTAYLLLVSPLCWGGGVYLDRADRMPLMEVSLGLAGTPAECLAFAVAPDAARAFIRECMALADIASD
jgi:hypothetical protein